MKYITTVDEHTFTINIDEQGSIEVDGVHINADMQQALEATLHSIIIDGKSYDARIEPREDGYLVQAAGNTHNVIVQDERTHRLAGLKSVLAGNDGEAVIKAPMPGIVVEIPIAVGDAVEKGQIVIVLESMKMHNEFKAPKSGTIHAIRVKTAEKVEKNSILLTIA